jgi:predicted DsbA family dithiol-disulfide isomerase
VKIEIYSDIACPWCYIGERRFERALASFDDRDGVEVVFRPFQLDPSMPDRPLPMPDFLQRKFGPGHESMTRHVAAAAEAEGIRMDFERALVVNTLAAHRLLRLALEEHGAPTQRKLAELLFEAYFERGADVSRHDTLAALAEEAGMDGDRARAYLEAGEGVEETRAEVEEASRIGVRAVPTFVLEGRYAVEGAQEPEAFLRVFERVRSLSEAVDAGEPA